jgi:cell pole-organizing protein PopZ
MGDVSTEPTMEEILSSIKRVIEESESSSPIATVRSRRAARTVTSQRDPADDDDREDVLELSDRAPFADVEKLPPRGESILSAGAAEASRSPLEALSRMIVKPEVAGDDTLEGMVREMLRPMLRDWLDAQLPGIVEAMVAKEIARISGRGL